MSDTHPNAYRAEAVELRKQAAQLLDQAKTKEDQATEIEKSVLAPINEPDEVQPGGETYTPEAPAPKKLFSKNN